MPEICEDTDTFLSSDVNSNSLAGLLNHLYAMIHLLAFLSLLPPQYFCFARISVIALIYF